MPRRGFLKLSVGGGAGLVLAFHMPAGDPANARSASTPKVLNAYVRISPDNVVTLYSISPEIGQGIKTAFGLLLAEDLDADWKTVRVEQARIDPALYGDQQRAGGSTSIRRNWNSLRQAGAAARAMLVEAAAKEWNVPVAEVTTEASKVMHKASGKSLTYGALAEKAALTPVPGVASLKLKDRKDWRLLGKRYTGVDNRRVITGEPLFGIDVRLPGMLYANFTKCAARGGKVKSANLDQIKAMPGVKDAFILEGSGLPAQAGDVMPGVVVIATSTWAAFSAKKALEIEWDESEAAKESTSKAAVLAKQIAAGPVPQPYSNTGDVDAAFSSATKAIEAYYEYAVVAHANLEPMNATAWWHDGVMEMWLPTQEPNRGLPMIARTVGIAEDYVLINQTRAGGGFGRRQVNDFACEAAAIALRVNAPVKLQWTREDDFTQDFYRPGGFHMIKGAIAKDGRIDAWQNHHITYSHDGKSPVMAGEMAPNFFPVGLVPNVRFARSLISPFLTPTGSMRAPTFNVLVFVQQSFLHELAMAAGRDHLEMLLETLNRSDVKPAPNEPARPGNPTAVIYSAKRATDVVKLAAAKSDYGGLRPKGSGLGLAFSFGLGGHAATAVDLSVDGKKHITVHKITVALDVGPIVNLSGAENQVQGASLDALSTAMGWSIDIENGRVQQTNFNTYPLMRGHSAPPVEALFIQSDNMPSGLGEPAFPGLAPALGNAIFHATGERLRQLPFGKLGYTI
jgi:isoquinoline 1-oxidoreductase beta subunit